MKEVPVTFKQSGAKTRFSHDHPVEAIRGREIPSSGKVLRELARRCSWLIRKIERHARLHGPLPHDNPLLIELTAVAAAARFIDKGRQQLTTEK